MNEKLQNALDQAVIFGGKAVGRVAAYGNGFVQWAKEYPELALSIVVPVAVAGIKSTQSLIVNNRIKSERNRIDHTYYDPSSGMHWELKRKASNNDRAEILRRKAQGDDVYTILRNMNLLK